MFDYRLRKITPRFIAPIASLVPSKVSANQITVIGFGFGISSAISIIFSSYWLALLFFIVNRLLDGVDGDVARTRCNDSEHGQIFDITSDFFVYSAIPIAIAFEQQNFVSAILAAIMVSTYYLNAGIWMSQSKVTDEQSKGIIEGFETIVFYLAMILFVQYFIIIGTTFAFLVFATIVQRLVRLR